MISAHPGYGEQRLGDTAPTAVMHQLNLWLSTVLPAGRSFHLQPLPLAASFRRFFRVVHDTGTEVAMYAPPPMEDAHRFVRLAHLFHGANVPVPRIHAQDSSRGFVLMDDLGHRNLQAAYAAGEQELAIARAIDCLHRVQQIEPGRLPPYTAARLRDELGLFATWYVHGWCGKDDHPAWSETVARLADTVAAQPVTAVHRDYHCQNLLLSADGRFGVVDFQDALAGPALYDLASLLRDCYHRFPEQDVQRYLQTYLRGTPLQFDAAAELLDLTGLQRQLKAVGIFARLELRDGKSSHLKHIAPVLDHAAMLAARHRGYEWLSAWLNELAGDAPG